MSTPTQPTDFYNIFKQQKAKLDLKNLPNSDEMTEATFRFNSSKFSFKSSPEQNSKTSEIKEEYPSNLENLPSPSTKPKRGTLVMTNINENQVNVLNKGLSELSLENEKLKLQLKEALKMVRFERDRYKEIEKSHIRLEELAKQLQIAGLKEKGRADKLEEELINLSQKERESAKKESYDFQREIEFSVQKAVEECKEKMEVERASLKQNFQILLGEYQKLKELRLSDKPNVDDMKEKVHSIQKNLV